MTEQTIKRGSAMHIAFRVSADVTSVKKTEAVFSQNHRILVKECERADSEETVYRCYLTQEDTLSFVAGERIEVELKVLLLNGDVLLSEILTVECVKGLSSGVIA